MGVLSVCKAFASVDDSLATLTGAIARALKLRPRQEGFDLVGIDLYVFWQVGSKSIHARICMPANFSANLNGWVGMRIAVVVASGS